jgi:hypothetical protein
MLGTCAGGREVGVWVVGWDAICARGHVGDAALHFTPPLRVPESPIFDHQVKKRKEK